MIDAVLLFGFLNALFEFVLLSMLSPRLRLRLLGNEAASVGMHVSFLLLNITIHWGTLIGTMSGVLAFVSSIVTIQVARKLFGQIKEDRYYHVGLLKYSIEELR